MPEPLLRKIDAVTVPVPDLDAGLAFYCDGLGQELRWRNDEIGQAAVALPESDGEIVLTTRHGYEPNWLVESTDAAVEHLVRAGGRVVVRPSTSPSDVWLSWLIRSTTCSYSLTSRRVDM